MNSIPRGKVVPSETELKTLFYKCRQCGVCCKKNRNIPLQPNEVDFIKRMGGHVGIDVRISELQTKNIDDLLQVAKRQGKVLMIHPDDKGCVFLQKRGNKYRCRIYRSRPQICRGFKCNLADDSFLSFFGQDALCLLQ